MQSTFFAQLLKFVLERRGLVVSAVVAIVFVWAAIAGPRGVRMLLDKQEEIRTLQEQNAQATADNQRLRERIQRLNENKAEQEMEIRKNLKLVRPGETIFMLPEDKTK